MGGRDRPFDGGRHGVSSSCSLSGHAGAGRRTSTRVAPAGAHRWHGRRGAMRGRGAGRRRPREAGRRVNA
ncbi:hypothetical protein CFB50_20605 [Burkholderia sp. AU33423]|nr:hypothetical protein CFB50_20605 [Burkholderia sp. AU33423]